MSSRLLRLPLALLATSAALLAFDGCTIINGLVVPVDAGPATTPPTTTPDAALDSGDGCKHAVPPPRPTAPDTAEQQTVVVVAKQILLATPTGAVPVGYDLDDICTIDKGTEACLSDKPHTDPAGGIDNNAGDLFTQVKSRTDVEQRINDGIALGKGSLLIRISGYNGTPDDANVVVSVYASPGLLDGAGQPQPPTFVETEAWSLDEAQFSAITPDLPITTTTGYVAGGVAVAVLTSVNLSVSNSFGIKLKSAVLTADLDLTGPKPTMTGGIIAGRWAATDLLQVVARQRTSDAGKALCNDPTNYGIAKAVICADLDIMVDRIADRSGLACNATSASVRFVGAPASLGPKRKTVEDDPCPTFPSDSCRPDGG
jgi:hypothetical protein